MANTNFFVVKNGLAVGNTTSTKQVINSAGQWIGDPTGVIQDSYDTANLAIIIADAGYNHANSAYDAANNVFPQIQPAFDTANAAFIQANTANVLAQAAFDYANNISISSSGVVISDDNSSNSVYYVTFTSNTSGNLTSIKTSSEELTYIPSSGTLSLNSINLTANTNTSANALNLNASIETAIIDSLPTSTYRSAFYQIQISSGLEFHILNLNMVHNDSSVFLNTFGDTYSTETLGTFTANIVGGQLNLLFTPKYTSTTISFIRNAIAKLGVQVPIGSLGFVGEPVTMIFDAGYDLIPASTQWDYGTI